MDGVSLLETIDPLFRQAVEAIDAGDEEALKRLLTVYPRLVRERADCGEGYFRQPYLLWFVAENPIRNGKLPGNIASVAQLLIGMAQSESPDSLQSQLDYTLMLVSSGRVARECGVQLRLIDLLVEAGAVPDGAVIPALAHRETAAVGRLLKRGATLTLPVAVGLDRTEDVARLAPTAGPEERRLALAAAAFYGHARILGLLLGFGGVDLDAYCPAGFHAHSTPLHQAVQSGSFDAVRTLVEAGARLDVTDLVFQGTPLGWAKHMEQTAIAAYLNKQNGQSQQEVY
ncbi:ankyrin repeat domain-containing protein [Paenibacillus hodogayensis]|uniref:Ankyrin repeat domain-containing protein n=1 Tax=Paenibacillus hodogayensis TaxID=279208 RepID=A0ABV5VZC6_9BACL